MIINREIKYTFSEEERNAIFTIRNLFGDILYDDTPTHDTEDTRRVLEDVLAENKCDDLEMLVEMLTALVEGETIKG